MDDVERIVRSLTGPQRKYMTAYAKWCSPAIGHAERWMTFPPTQTLRVLIHHGLADRSGQISDLGLRVAQHLKQENAK